MVDFLIFWKKKYGVSRGGRFDIVLVVLFSIQRWPFRYSSLFFAFF